MLNEDADGVLPGREETRLIYLGVAHRYPQSAHLLRGEAAAWQKTASPLALM